MLFHTVSFLIFFATIYTLYLSTQRSWRVQNGLLLAASYFFYGSWDYRFLALIWISTLIDFAVGLRLGSENNERRRKILLGLSVAANLGILGFFKYFDFFVDSFVDLAACLSINLSADSLSIILPVGISFYTFQSMSYTIDIYRKQIKPTHSLLNFALFVAFFPQLVAGPIERAKKFLPQVEGPRRITASQVDAGIFLIIWGLFKKIVVADNAALITNTIFANYTEYRGLGLTVALIAFGMQVYCDFSGYSDIARGLSKLMGFELQINFKLPFLAKSPSDLWNRWHVSLSGWLRDYLYVPLGGNRRGSLFTLRNLMLTMILGGLWHGAGWRFVLWGAYHGLLLVVYRLLGNWFGGRLRLPNGIGMLWSIFKVVLMFSLFTAGWIIFRSTSWEQMVYFISHVGFSSTMKTAAIALDLLFFSLPVIIMHIFQYAKNDLLIVTRLGPVLRSPIYAFLICGMLVFGVRESIEFFYFQF